MCRSRGFALGITVASVEDAAEVMVITRVDAIWQGQGATIMERIEDGAATALDYWDRMRESRPG